MQITKPVTKPTKQRKMLHDAPRHLRHKLFAAHLSPELRGTHLLRSFPVRSGDTVRIVRGDHEGFEGKVSRIDMIDYRVFLEGLTREKVDGTTIFVAVHPSKVMITRLNLDDKWRKKVLERKQKTRIKPEETRRKAKPTAKRKALESVELKEPIEEKLNEPVQEKIEEPSKEEALKEITQPQEGKAVVTEKPQKKRAAARARGTAKQKKDKARKETEPTTEKKRAKRKTTKKTEAGA
jgi:large subunit ribosomal protein L24